MKSLHRILFALFLAVSAISGCTDPIEEIPVKISLNKTLMSSLPVGSQQQLEAVVKPEGTDITVVWESDNEAVASVDADGIVTGVSVGTAVITASAGDASAECKVTVVALKPTAISLSPAKLQMKPGDTRELAVAFTPAEAVAEDLVWETSDASVAAVKDGVVTAAGEGEAIISVKCNGGNLAAVCRVTVSEDYVPVLVTSIELDPEEVEMQVGDKKTLKIKYFPENAEEVTDLVWESSDSKVASVSDGIVEALTPGSATVTAKCMGGEVTATCEVTVSEKQDPGHGEDDLITVAITVDGGVSDIQVGTSLQLSAVYTPSTAVPSSVKWSVDNPEYAVVDNKGLLTAIWASQNASTGDWNKIVVRVNADGKEASMSFRVIPRQPDDLSIDLPDGPLKMGQAWELHPSIIPEELNSKYKLETTLGSPVVDGVFKSSQPGSISFGFYISSTYADIVYSFQRYYSIAVEPYWVETVSLPETAEMDLGSSTTFVPTFTSDVDGVQPSYAKVKWTSSDPSVASVDEMTGEILALKEGETVITAVTCEEWAVPAGTGHKSASCKVTVRSLGEQLNVGDYYYSDGTWSSDLQGGKTVIGVVFAKVNATSSDPLLAQACPDCTHGLVVSTIEYADQDFGAVSTYYGHGYYAGLGYDANAVVDEDKVNGYGNTAAHTALNGSRQDYCVMFNAESGVVSAHSQAAPSSASAWYVPSFKEMSMMAENIDVLNSAINAVGGMPLSAYQEASSWDENRTSDWYWTSTIHGTWYDRGKTYDHHKYPFDVSSGNWTDAQQSSALCKVRMVLAF